MVLAVPAAHLLVFPAAYVIEEVIGLHGFAPFIVWLFLAAAAGLATSVIAGRRLARRLARRHPGDPPTPATVGMTLLFGSIFFGSQVVLSAVMFFTGCVCTLVVTDA
jgi:hypothetical protein